PGSIVLAYASRLGGRAGRAPPQQSTLRVSPLRSAELHHRRWLRLPRLPAGVKSSFPSRLGAAGVMEQTEAESSGLSRRVVYLMAAGCGLTVANIYYSQPLLQQMAENLRVSEAQIGSIPALT